MDELSRRGTLGPGLGVGRALVDHVERELLAPGCPKMSLQARATNPDVVRFCEHLGYRVDETIDLGKRLTVD